MYIYNCYVDDSPPEEPVEEVPLDLNDFEENIHNNIMEDEPLETEVMNIIIKPWWKEEPFKLVFSFFFPIDVCTGYFLL